jgi:hypothetical protein
MKLTLSLIVAIWTISLTAQNETVDKKGVKASLNSSMAISIIENDSIPIVQYITSDENKNVVFNINGVFVNSSIIGTIDPNLIDSLRIDKKEIEINGEKYSEQFILKMKNDYHPKTISLSELKLKYLKPSNNPVIFMIDNNIIKGDYTNFVVDENNILKIVVDKTHDDKSNIDIVKLITKSNNIKNKNIRIRGLYS